MGFESCKADSDICFCSTIKADGTDYYQHVLLYTNGIIAIMQILEDFINHEMGKFFWWSPTLLDLKPNIS